MKARILIIFIQHTKSLQIFCNVVSFVNVFKLIINCIFFIVKLEYNLIKNLKVYVPKNNFKLKIIKITRSN